MINSYSPGWYRLKHLAEGYTPPTGGVVNQTTLSSQVNYTGPGYLAGEFPGGTTTVEGVPVSATVRVLYRPESGHPGDGAVVAEVQSTPAGTWRITGLNPDLRYDVVGRLEGRNDVIMAGIQPTRTDIIVFTGSFESNEEFDGLDGFVELIGGLPPYSASVINPLPLGLFPVVDGRKLLVDGVSTDSGAWNPTIRVTSDNGVSTDIQFEVLIGFAAPEVVHVRTTEASIEFDYQAPDYAAVEVYVWMNDAFVLVETMPAGESTFLYEAVDPDTWYTFKLRSVYGDYALYADEFEVLAANQISATGGVIDEFVFEGQTYRTHTFLESGSFIVTAGGGDLDYLIVGGGGAGGRINVGGGGGGGGVVTGTLVVTLDSYPVIVGAGGLCPNTQNRGDNGEDSSVFGVVAFGGGGGGASTIVAGKGLDGGSGGGSGGRWTESAPPAAALGIGGQGNNGGIWTTSQPVGTSARAGAGGGGAGQAGANAGSGVGGKGGDGVQSSITGTATYYGGGGGGGSNGGTRGLGGLGGGGAGGRSGQICEDGSPNTGGGGGGRSENTPPNTSAPGGSGGSGIVIIRYPITL